MSIICAFRVTKNTRLSTPAQLQYSRSRAWEPGNEANRWWLCVLCNQGRWFENDVV